MTTAETMLTDGPNNLLASQNPGLGDASERLNNSYVSAIVNRLIKAQTASMSASIPCLPDADKIRSIQYQAL